MRKGEGAKETKIRRVEMLTDKQRRARKVNVEKEEEGKVR